ncbi:MAG TPA: hypothetical protein VNC19_03240 [Gemmatimonadales bacterium]|nr:hypothetical protein [Gemmatimonadales bacterium]
MHAIGRSGRRLPSLALAAVVVVVVASLAGCSHKRGPAVVPDPAEKIRLEIENHHYLDVTVYAVHDGQLTRLGVAGGSAHTEIMLPARLLGAGRELRLYGDPIGSSDRAVSDVIVVQPGQYIEWLLEPGLERSTLSAY